MSPERRGRAWFLAAGCSSSAMGLFHLGIAVVGAPAYRLFGGAAFAERAAAGSFVPAAQMVVITLVFALFALYAFAGAGAVPRPPLLRTGLVFVGALYGVHGLFLVPAAFAYLTHRPSPVPSNMVVDAIFLAMAIPYVAGTVRAWPELGQRSGRD